MKLILLGAPGSGKGTQAKMLADRWSVPHISTGDILRQAVRDETELGRRAAPIMATGGLVPDELMIGIIADRLGAEDAAKGFILDGFPRTVAQAEKLDTLVSGNGSGNVRVLHLLVPDDVIVGRIAARRSCPSCGATYHLVSSPPRVEGICDRCGEKLTTRPDDTESAVRRRLDEFHQRTLPVVGHYRAKSWLREVDGLGAVEQVFERVEQSLV